MPKSKPTPAPPPVTADKKRSFTLFKRKVAPLDVALTVRHLSVMLKSGMALSDALLVIIDQVENPRLKEAYQTVYNDIQGGMNLSESMKKYPDIFSEVMTSIISVGEQGGTLEKNLIFLADFLKKNHELNQKVKGALIYPVIVFVITVAEMLGVMFFVLPKLESLFSGFEQVPPFTVFILSVSQFLRNNFIIIIGVLALVVFIINRYFKTQSGQRLSDRIKLKFPVVKNLNRKHILTNFSRTLGILLESGIPISNALKITSDTMDNYVYSEVLKKVHTSISEGKNLADSLREYKEHFPSTYIKMIEVGEETGTLEENLAYLYEFYQLEVREMTENLTTLLEPVLLVFIGIMIGILAIIIVGPIYQLTGSINS